MHFGPHCTSVILKNFHYIFSKSALKIVELYRSSPTPLISEIINMIIDITLYFGKIVQNTPHHKFGHFNSPPQSGPLYCSFKNYHIFFDFLWTFSKKMYLFLIFCPYSCFCRKILIPSPPKSSG